MKTGLFFLFLLPLSWSQSFCQNFIGLSLNYGNKVSYTPTSSGFSRPSSFSGNIAYLKRETINNGWFIDTNLNVGLLGYNQKVTGLDTLSVGWDINSSAYFYETFYFNGSLSLVKMLNLSKLPVLIGLGGGITYYAHTNAPSQYSIGIGGQTVFESSTRAESGSLSGLLKLYSQFQVRTNWTVELAYLYAFNSAISGTYQFLHTVEGTTSGTFNVYQREIKVGCYYMLSKRKLK